MDLRAIVTMPYLSGKPEDIAVNVLHFSVADRTSSTLNAVQAQIEQLYNVTPPNGPSNNALFPVAGILTNALNRNALACTTKFYILEDAKPRTPSTRTWTLGPSLFTADKELPAEVALCVSVHDAAKTPRTRGRIYFGPFVITATEDDPTHQRSRPSVTIRECLGGAVKRMMTQAAGAPRFGVYTRGIYQSNGVVQPEVPGSIAISNAGWVDDAWDTQRRRGQDASLRYSFTAAPV